MNSRIAICIEFASLFRNITILSLHFVWTDPVCFVVTFVFVLLLSVDGIDDISCSFPVPSFYYTLYQGVKLCFSEEI